MTRENQTFPTDKATDVTTAMVFRMFLKISQRSAVSQAKI